MNNNKETFSEESLTVNDIIRIKNFTFKFLVTKVNNKLVKKEDRESTVVNDKDNVVILHLISGG